MTTITVSDNANKYEAWPSVVQLENGTLVCCYRTCDTNTHLYDATGQIVVRQSDDNGLTWGDEVVAAKYGVNNDNRNGCLLIFGDAGVETILMPFCVWDGTNPDHVYITKSTDGGLTWSAPSLISLNRGVACKPRVLSNGDIIFTAYGFNKVGETVFLTGTLYLYKSSDNGETWDEIVIHDNDGAGQCNESAVIETRDENGEYNGGVLVIARANPSSSPQYRKFRSTDYGETWTEEDNETGLTDSYKCTKLELHRPRPEMILCSYFETTIYSTAIMVSTDEGATWENKVLIPLDGVGGKGYADTILLDNTWTLATVTCVNSVYSNVHISFTNFRLFKEYLTNLYRIDVSNRVSVPSRNVVVSRKSRN